MWLKLADVRTSYHCQQYPVSTDLPIRSVKSFLLFFWPLFCVSYTISRKPENALVVSGSFTRPNPWCMDAYVNCVPPGKENQGQKKHLNHLPFITHWVAKKKTRESIVSSMDHQSVCGTPQWAWVREGVCEDERVVRQADWLDLSSGNHQQLHWKATPSPSYLASHLIHCSSNPVFLSPPCNFL